MQITTLALLLAVLLVSVPPDAESDAFDAAFALKKAGKSAEAAAKFEEIAKTYPASPRVGEALVEAGVGWFGVARSKQTLHRSNTESSKAFTKAFELFKSVAEGHSSDPAAARAQYMCGSTHMFLGDLGTADQEFTVAMQKYPADRKYFGKSLERRAAARRGLLETDLALADLQLYQKEFPKGGDDSQSVDRYLQIVRSFDKPARPLEIESWIQGGPTSIAALKGNVVGVYFSATWCPHCAEELTFMLDLNQRYERAGLKLIGVFNHSEKQTVASVAKYLAESGITWPACMESGRTAEAYLGSKIPDLVLIDKRGMVRWHDNPATLADWTIEALLGEDATAPVAPVPPKSSAPQKPN